MVPRKRGVGCTKTDEDLQASKDLVAAIELIDKKEYDAAINLLVPEKTSTDAASAKTTASKDEAEKAAKKFSNTVFTNMTDRM